MGMIEAPFGDLILGIMQSATMRWGAALVALIWVWSMGDKDARLRRFYLAAPLVLAGLIQLADMLVLGAATGQSGQGGWFPHYLNAMEAFRRITTALGVGAILAAALAGFFRLIGLVPALAVLLCAFFADQMALGAKSFFSAPILAQIFALLPAVLLVLMAGYGLGAIARHLRERFDDAE